MSSTHGEPTHANEPPVGRSPTIPARARLARSIPLVAHGAATALTVTALVVLAGCGGGGSRSSSGTVARRADAAKPALDALRSAMEAGNPDPVVANFADDVQLHSPALIGPEYRGRDVVASIVTAAMQVLDDVRVTDLVESADGATGGVVFDARVGGQPAQGFVLLRFKGERVSEVTLLLRPLPALKAFVTRMGELGAQPALDARKG